MVYQKTKRGNMYIYLGSALDTHRPDTDHNPWLVVVEVVDTGFGSCGTESFMYSTQLFIILIIRIKWSDLGTSPGKEKYRIQNKTLCWQNSLVLVIELTRFCSGSWTVSNKWNNMWIEKKYDKRYYKNWL